jgi:cell division transport system ATP-binding protein
VSETRIARPAREIAASVWTSPSGRLYLAASVWPPPSGRLRLDGAGAACDLPPPAAAGAGRATGEDAGDAHLVRFENVGMRYGAGHEVLRDITMRLAPGGFYFLTGPSGAGKSSLLKLIYLADRPSRGLISLFGRDLATAPRADLPALRRRIGVVFQDFRLIPHLSALDNVALPLRVAGHRDDRIRENVAELLRWVGLAEHLEARPATLSGGQQQRVAIARAVVSKPSLLLADEPTGNVDDVIGARLLRLFEELNKQGTTILVATHSEALVTRFPHTRLHLENGELSVLGTAARRGALA